MGEITPEQVGELVAVVGWALLTALTALVLLALGSAPWAWAWREVRGAWRYFVAARWHGYGQFADGIPDVHHGEREQRSQAAEHDRERPGTGEAERVPALVKLLAALSDAELLEVLALLPGEDEDFRFADSRLAKFIPGRVADNLAEVRVVRDKEAPPPPGRYIPVRDNGRERLLRVE